ncbi:MAG: hypothetical protein CMJ18_15315 [Phycisphaeraceae bacterium]|nr:hypothetical protein [Phycisphaeraceae bacterium]
MKTLTDIAEQPFAVRVDLIRSALGADLHMAIRRAVSAWPSDAASATGEIALQLPHDAFDVDRICHAIAWNIGADQSRRRRFYGNADTLRALRPKLRLPDLAWSVACEQRCNWQDGGSTPGDVDFRNRARVVLTALIARFDAELRSFICSRLTRITTPRGMVELHADDVGQEVWTRLFVNLWSPSARKRFPGTSTLRTLILGYAKMVMLEHRVEVRKQPATEYMHSDCMLALDKSRVDAPDHGDEHVIRRLLDELLCRLPPKRCRLATRHFRDLRRKAEIAEEFGVTRAFVTKELRIVRQQLERCLRDRDLTIDDFIRVMAEPVGVAAS